MAASTSSAATAAMSSSSSSSSSSRAGAAPSTAVGDVANDAEAQRLLASVLADRAAEGGAVAKTVSSVPGDTCTWYANRQCDVARSCFDCLNTRLLGNTQICMIDTYGVCVSMSKYDPAKDFRRARPLATLLSASASVASPAAVNLYPSTNASYCARADPYCQLCLDNWDNPFADNTSQQLLSRLPFCRGRGGCVCVHACEMPYRNDNVILQRCVTYNYSAPSAETMFTSIGFLAALFCVVAIVTCATRRYVRRRSRANARPAFRHDLPLPQRAPTGPRLGLSGWHSMREKLIQSERDQLQTAAESNAAAVVPMIGETPGPAVTFEASDEYLPASPSGLAAHQQRLQQLNNNDDCEDNGADTSQQRRRASSEPTASTHSTSHQAPPPPPTTTTTTTRTSTATVNEL